jgi:predicted negative regulator of RcsB-dependent stress response
MSKRRPGTRKAQQETSQDPDDVFLANVLHLGKWAEANQQLLTIVAVVLAIGVAGGIYYLNYRRGLVNQASQQLETIYQSVQIADLEGARDELGTFLDRFSGTPYEAEARLLLGDLYVRDGSPQQAEAVLRPLGASPKKPLEFQAAMLLAAAYEQDGQAQQAEQVYLAIADRSDLSFQVRDALQAAARLRVTRGDRQGAIDLYQRAMEGLDQDAPERGVYEMRIEELKSEATA